MTKPAAIDACKASISALVMMHNYGQEDFLVLTADKMVGDSFGINNGRGSFSKWQAKEREKSEAGG